VVEETGEFFGTLTMLLYFLAILIYLVKFVNYNYSATLTKNPKLHNNFIKFMKFIVQRHKLFGVLTVSFLLLHFLIQFGRYGLNITGIIAAAIMLLQVGLGIYGDKALTRGGTWLSMHRIIAFLLLIAIGLHVE